MSTGRCDHTLLDTNISRELHPALITWYPDNNGDIQTRPRHIPHYFWLTWWGVTGPKWLKEVILPPHLPCSDVQVQVQCDHLTILVPSHCVLLANVGEFLVKSSLFVRPRSASTFLKCLSFGQLDLLKSGFSRSLIWCHRHISIFGVKEKQKLPQIVFTLIHTSSTLLRCWLTCASCDLSQPIRGQHWGHRPIRSQQSGLAAGGCEGQLAWEPSGFWVKQNILGKMILHWAGGETRERQWDAW